VVKQAKIKESDRVEVPIMTRRSISVFGKSSDGRYGIGSIWMQDGYLVLATVGAGDAKTINQLSYTWGTVLGSIEPLNALELGEETIALPDAGLTIQYPKGWTIDPKNPLLVYESEKDAANGSALPEKNAVGLLDQSLKDYGLKDDATIDDVVRVNKGAMGLKESSITSSEFIILDQPAITLKAANGATSDDTHWGFLTQFIYNGRAVTLVAIAPTEKALDEFEPTWLAMLRSIKATEKSAK